ncbi:hypothetical protein BJX99DRAFT_181755 [Aspergillus californicus]
MSGRMAPQMTLFYGTFIDLPRTKSGEKHELSVKHGALCVSAATGQIEEFWSISSEEELQVLLKKNCWTGAEVIRAREEQNEFFFPGFIDTHIHAPQYPNSGLFGSSTLLDWLDRYTFPLESSLSSVSTAHSVYNTVISRTLANGTTFASYFATIHVPATNLLATLCHKRGQRALIGRVCMDNPSFCPDYYCDQSAEDSLEKTKESIKHIHSLDPKGNLVKPIVTPRFVPTCSREALTSLGKLAAEYSPPLHIQTHISENKDEVALVKTLFPESSSYAGVYDTYSLLTPRTILAHAVHIDAAEQRLIASRDARISHCPSSNSALGSGIAPVRDILNAGVTVGLGTDVSGGYSPSILEAARQACLVSRLLRHTAAYTETGRQDGTEVLSVEESLYLATRGGAAVVDMASEIGGFEKGMFFDAQLISLGSTVLNISSCADEADLVRDISDTKDSVVDIFGWESWTEKVHKWVWTGNERNVRSVWVRARLVHSLGTEDKASTFFGTGLGLLSGVGSGEGWAKYLVTGLGVGALGWVLGKRGR